MRGDPRAEVVSLATEVVRPVAGVVRLAAGVVLWVVVVYNRLVGSRNKVREAWSGIDDKDRTEIVLLVRATTDATPPAVPPREPRRADPSLPELALPEHWSPTTAPR